MKIEATFSAKVQTLGPGRRWCSLTCQSASSCSSSNWIRIRQALDLARSAWQTDHLDLDCDARAWRIASHPS